MKLRMEEQLVGRIYLRTQNNQHGVVLGLMVGSENWWRLSEVEEDTVKIYRAHYLYLKHKDSL